MLQLQRASAGSGKTFTLAKKFIWYLIAIKDKERDGKWRLRTPREIDDGLQRILAITFTNKATNEMKQRIVQKLADLTKADSHRPLTPEERKAITYLDDFIADLNTTPEKIGSAAKRALSVLLNDYSDFKVSTIDSFFQTVLRTFAYESNLNDAYQVEIDNEYVAAAAVNATLNEVDASDSDSIPAYWIHRLMEEESEKGTKNWNVFQKSNSDTSIYSRLLKSVQRLESEDFKKVREKLDKYFESSSATFPAEGSPVDSDPLRAAYLRAIKEVRDPVEQTLAKAKRAAEKLKQLFKKNNLNPKEVALRFMDGHLEKLPTLTPDSPKNKLFTAINMGDKASVFKTSGRAKTPVVSCPDDALMYSLACEMYENYGNFINHIMSSDWKHWKIYGPQLPYLGLIGVTRLKMKEYLDANNTIQLGETNSMLRSIIGKDDTPFIYERLGTHLNHFLIDEFQDTSRLQWENLLPLLRESNGRGEDNLIIGDAKQSIYRFRNADPSLITDAVPTEFPERIDAGMSRSDNTNWRSDRTIVEFNNYFFYALMQRVAALSEALRDGIILPDGSPPSPIVDFRNLYSNVAQYPSHRDHEGYIEVNFLESPEASIDSRGRKRKLSSEERQEFMRRESLTRLGPLITSLIERGYRQKDIAILVRTNTLGKEVIDTLVKYNNTPGLKQHVEIISEESLLVSSSEAVGIIIGILEKMADGSVPPSPTEQMKSLLTSESTDDAVNEMLASMQTVALPALVEAITEKFVGEDLRHSQAVFIAALQDMVLEYTERHSADISSFIDWWRTKGVARSIASPEGTDAVQVMTIHKSKGLEFKCVIMPFDDSYIVPKKKSEWKWVRPSERFMSLGFPPFIPVETVEALMETVHCKEYLRFYDLSSMDMLNAYYVAFTRAVSELYIFTRHPGENPKENASTLGSTLREFFSESSTMLYSDKIDEIRDTVTDEEAKSCMLPAGSATWDEGHYTLTIGTRKTLVKDKTEAPDSKKQMADADEPSSEKREPDNGNEAKEENKNPIARVIEVYHVDSSPSVLQYVEADDDAALTTMLPDADDLDPRSEGNILHAVMAMVKTPHDLHRAFLQQVMRGYLTRAQAEEWETRLSEALCSDEVLPWFSPGWRVLNEREIIFPGMKNRRPDRIMISKDGKSAVIIDYKFGELPSGNAHIKQVEQYLSGLREVTGIRNLKGYLWYVFKNRIIPVALPSLG